MGGLPAEQSFLRIARPRGLPVGDQYQVRGDASPAFMSATMCWMERPSELVSTSGCLSC